MDPTPPVRRLPSAALASLVVVAVVVVGLLVRTAASPEDGPVDDVRRATTVLRRAAGDHLGPSTTADGRVGEADGVVPDGVTVFDDEYPGIANVDPDLLAAMRAAATDAAAEGVTFEVHSAWRSPEYQAELLDDAVAEHGSEEAAARWVARPERSLHVSGDAVDIGGPAAREWVADHGAPYGLCRVYDNEPWHVELRPEAVEQGCPPAYADPTQDPRLG